MAPNHAVLAPSTSQDADAEVAVKVLEPDVAGDVSVEVNEPQRICQVCFETCTVQEGSVETFETSDHVTRLCGKTCTCSLCVNCFREHLRVAIAACFAGILPKIRCPICLVPMNKSRWAKYATPELIEQYKKACASACMFQSMCCHNVDYTHLPVAYNETPERSQKAVPSLMLIPSLQRKLPALKALVRRFCNHHTPAKDVVVFIEDQFGQFVPNETQLLLLEHLLPRIMDEERRAALLLCYHAKYKKIRTRCCGMALCFNCKRRWDDDTMDPLVCKEEEIGANCVVECRSCRVTIIKVQGCDYVRCLCGYEMDWDRELQIKDLVTRQLVPLDCFDTTIFDAWWRWQTNMIYFLKNKALKYLHIDRPLPKYRKLLRRFLQRRLYRLRFSHSLPKLQEELRLKCFDRFLRKYPALLRTMRGYVRRITFRKIMPELKKELRLKCIEREIPPYRKVFRPMLQRRIWLKRFSHNLQAMQAEMRLARLGQVVHQHCAVLHPKAQRWMAHQRWGHVCESIRLSLEWRIFFGSYP